MIYDSKLLLTFYVNSIELNGSYTYVHKDKSGFSSGLKLLKLFPQFHEHKLKTKINFRNWFSQQLAKPVCSFFLFTVNGSIAKNGIFHHLPTAALF